MVIKDLLETLKQSPANPDTPILLHELNSSPISYVEDGDEVYLKGIGDINPKRKVSAVYFCGESGAIQEPNVPYQLKDLIQVLEKLVKLYPEKDVRFRTEKKSTVVRVKEKKNGIYLLGYEDPEVVEYITEWYQAEVAKGGYPERTLSTMLLRGFPLPYVKSMLGDEEYELACKIAVEDIAGKIKHEHARILKQQAIFKEQLMRDIIRYEDQNLMDRVLRTLEREDILFWMGTLDAEKVKTILI